MKTTPLLPQLSDEDRFRQIAPQLEATGYVIFVFGPARKLWSIAYCCTLSLSKTMSLGWQVRAVPPIITLVKALGGDKIRWIDGHHPATHGYLAWVEALRLSLNRHLFFGACLTTSATMPTTLREPSTANTWMRLRATPIVFFRRCSTSIPSGSQKMGGALVLYDAKNDHLENHSA